MKRMRKTQRFIMHKTSKRKKEAQKIILDKISGLW